MKKPVLSPKAHGPHEKGPQRRDALAIATMERERSTIRTLEELLEDFPGIGLPLLNVGTIFLRDNSVAVSGSVSPEVVATAELTINGHRVPITEFGTFCAVVRLDAQGGLKLSLGTQTHPGGHARRSTEGQLVALAGQRP